jgi:Clp amino terminal domain, pathogenicity island component
MVPRLTVCVQPATAAARDEDSVLGTQHPLLGLLHAGLAANVLDRLGVTREKVRDTAARLFVPVVTTVDGQERRVVGDGQGDSALAGPGAGARPRRVPARSAAAPTPDRLWQAPECGSAATACNAAWTSCDPSTLARRQAQPPPPTDTTHADYRSIRHARS